MKEGHFFLRTFGLSEEVSYGTFKILKESLDPFLPPFILWNEGKTHIKTYGYTLTDYEYVSDKWKVTPEQRRKLFQVCQIIVKENLKLGYFRSRFCVWKGDIYIVPNAFGFDAESLDAGAFCRFASFLCLNQVFIDFQAAKSFVIGAEEEEEAEEDPRLRKFLKRLQVHGFADENGALKWQKLSIGLSDMQERTRQALEACRGELRRFAGEVMDGEFYEQVNSIRNEYYTPKE